MSEETRLRHWSASSQELKQRLKVVVSAEEMRLLHDKQPMKHAAIVVRQLVLLALATAGLAVFESWTIVLPLALVQGFTLFNFTVLLHEVVHQAVTNKRRPALLGFLARVYAGPSGISAAQFTKWHLDHHAELGDSMKDPKRHWLSPKRNKRWIKLLYYTPALFFIYFRAARAETATYPAALQRTIGRERTLTIATHVALLAAIGLLADWGVALRVYVIPYFGIFPIAFALNRLGQHYDIDPSDPAKWGTLIKGNWFWDFAFIYSNYHLEHHYFPGVPFYNLPRLQRLLIPFYREIGAVPRGYGGLLWDYLVLNRAPHTNWQAAPAAQLQQAPV